MLVSILIPCYNAERWVAQAIESALAQTWSDKEVIVVDDGSTDGSLKEIQKFERRIQWETGPNLGSNVARNRLLELARGEWLQYLDADDYLLPPKIERQVAFLMEQPECDVVYSPVWWVRWSETSVEKEITQIPGPHDPASLLARWWLPQTGGPIWRKEAVMRAGSWKVDQPCCQEHELYLRLLMTGARFLYFGEAHAAYRDWRQDEGVSKRNLSELLRRRLEIEQRLEDFLRERGELTPSRTQAINQARFEIARRAWLEDRAAALEIMRSLNESQTGFVPEGPAAPTSYRAVYCMFGFAAAEKLAALKRAVV